MGEGEKGMEKGGEWGRKKEEGEGGEGGWWNGALNWHRKCWRDLEGAIGWSGTGGWGGEEKEV